MNDSSKEKKTGFIECDAENNETDFLTYCDDEQTDVTENENIFKENKNSVFPKIYYLKLPSMHVEDCFRRCYCRQDYKPKTKIVVVVM